MSSLRVGPNAVLVEVGSTQEAMALYAAARAQQVDARDVVPGARTVLFDGIGPGFAVPEPMAAPETARRHVDIPVTYDGPDLEETASLLGLSAAELADLHAATTFTVAFCGFAPGFAYCTGLDRSVPRLETPRPRVAPGSVGMAGEFTGVYPTASPGGWRIVGHTEVELWDARRAVPALLAPGTTVRFIPTGES